MPSNQSSHFFQYNEKFWRIFGIWEGRKSSKYYKYYSLFYIFLFFFIYNILLTLNLIYTPLKIELYIQEVTFNFTEITVAAKAFTIIGKRKKILRAFEIMDSDVFLGDYEDKDGILYKLHASYLYMFKVYAISSISVFFLKVLVSTLIDLVAGNDLELPICVYYFLSDEHRSHYYIYWFIYQSLGMFGHMMYNVNIDSFIAGLLVINVAHIRLLNAKLSNFKLTEEECTLPKEQQDKISIVKLNGYLKYYEVILEFYDTIQDILSMVLFIQFCFASIIICVVMCSLLLPTAVQIKAFLAMYLFIMSGQIFVPAYLGTKLFYESQNITLAAYNGQWINRSLLFKKSLILLIERAKKPVVITGLNMFPLTLVTFTSIMKTAYSFFTLIRNSQKP